MSLSGFQEMFSIVIRLGTGGPGALQRTLKSLSAQSYRNFEIIVDGGQDADRWRDDFVTARGLFGQAGLQMAELLQGQSSIWRGDYLMLVDAGDSFAADALDKINAAIHGQAGQILPDFIIFDHRLRDGEIRHLPGWDPDLFQQHDYVLRAFAVWRGLFERFPVQADKLDPWLSGLTQVDAHVVHIPQVLMELDAEKAPVRPLMTPLTTTPAVSIIIPNKNSVELLASCTAFLNQMASPFELILVDNGSDDPAVWRLYDELKSKYGAKVLHFNAPFNYSTMMNMGVGAAQHELLLFLNNDVVIEDARSIAIALDYAARPEVGIVGSVLRYPDGSVQHAGMVVRQRPDGSRRFVHVLAHEIHDERGHIGALTAPRNWQAVTGAFHVLRKSAFLAAGQFDEVHLPIETNDVDLCLQLRKRGLRVVCLPLEGITHAESKTRRHMDPEQVRPVKLASLQVMNKRWPEALASDPYENPKLRSLIPAKPKAQQARQKANFKTRLKRLPAKIVNRFGMLVSLRSDRAAALLAPQRPNSSLALKPGLSIIGFLTSETGLGEAARQMSYACDSGRVAASLVDRPLEQHGNEPAFTTLCQPIADRRMSVIVCGMKQARNLMAAAGDGRICVAYPFWELPEVPQAYRTGLEGVSEFWAASSFIAAALERSTSRPVRLIRQAVMIPTAVPTPKLRGDKLRFFTFFDFGSNIHRKNPIGVIAAFKAAFVGRKDVELVIKARGKDTDGARRLLQRAVSGDPRIRVIDATFSRSQMSALMAQTDAFVSLHRSEGFGFGAAEALAHGRAVVATDWGGSTDFINEMTGYPVAYNLRPVLPGEFKMGEGQHWAEPSLDAAVAAMRRIDEHPDEANAKALEGFKLLSRQHSHAVIGAEIARALSELSC